MPARLFRRLFTSSHRVARERQPQPRFRPELEALEMRLVPTLGPSFGIDASAFDTDSVAVAINAAGHRVAVYDREDGADDRDIFARRFDAAGTPIGPEITVAMSGDDEFDPDVAIDSSGNFVVVWTVDFNNSGHHILKFRTFSSAGAPITSGSLADSSDQTNACVTMNAAGRWVVAFQAQAFHGGDIFARRFDLNGQQLGNEILVATNPLQDESHPVIDGNAKGRFAIAYKSSDSLFLRRYQANGTLLGKAKIPGNFPAFLAGSYDVAMDNAGNSTVVYTQFDSSGYDIFSRTVSAANALGKRRIVAATTAIEHAPRIAMDRVTRRYVVSYFEQTEGVQVSEFSKKGVKLAQELTGNSYGPAISCDAGTYFVGYLFYYGPNDNDVHGRFGTL